MPQPRVPKNGVQRSQPKRVAEDMRPRQVFTRLEDIPIADALHEKVVFEAGDFERKLNARREPEIVVISAEARNARIVEVYRRCLEEAVNNDRLAVVRDFFAHFPHLVCDAAWLKPLLQKSTETHRKEILTAMANGLKAAARRRTNSAVQESYRIKGARAAMGTIQDELSRWNEGLQRAISTHAEVELASSKKAGEFARIYGLGAIERRRLQKMLGAGQCYKAAILLTAKAFRVRQRDLQTRSGLESA